MIRELSQRQIDLLREIANIGSGNAVTALSQLLHRRVFLNVPEVRILPVEEVPEVAGGAERLVVGLFFRVFGEVKGSILILFPKESALALIQGLLQGEVAGRSILREMEASALKEVGNILTAAYLNAISQVLKMVLIHSVPGLALDMAGAVLDSILIEVSRVSDWALLIETEFVTESKITGHFFLLPDPESLGVIMRILDPASQNG